MRLIGFTVFLFITQVVSAQYYHWAKRAGGLSYDSGYDVISDKEGNVYVTGKFLSDAAFGNNSLKSRGSGDIFIVKYNPAGEVLWIKQAGGPGSDSGNGISLDDSGNVYVTGYFEETAVFDEVSLTSNGKSDIYTAKYNPQGALQWVQKAGGEGNDEGEKIKVDPSGNIYIIGNLRKLSAFGNLSATAKGERDAFIAKLNSQGATEWVQTIGGGKDAYSLGLAADINGNAIITGIFEEKIMNGNSEILSKGAEDIFYAKYNPEGKNEWLYTLGHNGFDEGKALATDGDGNIYMAGTFSEALNLSEHNLKGKGNKEIFIAKLSPSGIPIWNKSAGGELTDKALALSVDTSGNAFVAGYFEGDAAFDGKVLISKGDRDIFVAKYNTDGNLEWAQRAGGKINDYAEAIWADNYGSVYITGSYQATNMFDNQVFLTNNGNVDIMTVKLSRNANTASKDIKSHFEVLPNVKRHNITLAFKNESPEIYEVYLINSDGFAVYEQKFKPTGGEQNHIIDVGKMPADTYLLNVGSKNANYFQKVTLKTRTKQRKIVHEVED